MSDMDEYIERLILAGAIEVAGIDSETGEFLYNFTPKLAEVDPRMYEQSLELFYEAILSLWEKGFLEMNIEEANPRVRLSDKAFNEEARKTLSVDDNSALETIIRAFQQ